MSRTEGFWSRRRAAVAAEATHAEAPVEPMPEVVEPRDDAEILAALGLPDPDTLRPGDDVAAFMARAVPAHLRRRALRRLWTSNPVLANVDSLVEYGGDFTDAGVKAGIVATAYEVGRGMTRHVERLAGDARADEARVRGPMGSGARPRRSRTATSPRPSPGPRTRCRAERVFRRRLPRLGLRPRLGGRGGRPMLL